jgi:hypothetical protein
MEERRPDCCHRCAGPQAAARIWQRHRFKSAVFPPASEAVAAEGPAHGAAARGPWAAAADRILHRLVPQPRDGTSPAPARVVTGTLLDASPHLVVIGSEIGEHRLLLTPRAAVWRGGPSEPAGLRLGERVVARVSGHRDVADKIWAGIGRVAGVITAAGQDGLEVDTGVTRPRQAVVIAARSADRIRVRLPHLLPGHLIDVIGLRRGGVLEACVPATAQPAYLAGRVNRAVAAPRPERGTISGTAAWHEPGPAAMPQGLDYPAIDPAAGCLERAAAGTGCAALPYLAVGSRVLIRNECTGLADVLPVTGCGVTAARFHDRCLACGASRRGRIADLALESFVALGGDLEVGCFSAMIEAGW